MESIGKAKGIILEKDSMFLFVMMSHGGPGFIESSDGQEMWIEDDIVEPFDGNNCKKLKNKPKVFIIQSCRGQSK